MHSLTLAKRHAHAHKHTHPHQVIHVGFACRVDVLQELQQIEGVTVHQMDSYGQIWLVLELIQEYKYSISTSSAQVIGGIFSFGLELF